MSPLFLAEQCGAALARDDVLRGAQVNLHGGFVAVAGLDQRVVDVGEQPLGLLEAGIRQGKRLGAAIVGAALLRDEALRLERLDGRRHVAALQEQVIRDVRAGRETPMS